MYIEKKWEIKVTLKGTEKLNQRTSACTAWRINVSTICLYRKTSLHIACYVCVCVCVRRVWKCMHICWDQRVTIAWPSPVQRFTRNESTYQLRERERERETTLNPLIQNAVQDHGNSAKINSCTSSCGSFCFTVVLHFFSRSFVRSFACSFAHSLRLRMALRTSLAWP